MAVDPEHGFQRHMEKNRKWTDSPRWLSPTIRSPPVCCDAGPPVIARSSLSISFDVRAALQNACRLFERRFAITIAIRCFAPSEDLKKMSPSKDRILTKVFQSSADVGRSIVFAATYACQSCLGILDQSCRSSGSRMDGIVVSNMAPSFRWSHRRARRAPRVTDAWDRQRSSSTAAFGGAPTLASPLGESGIGAFYFGRA